MYLALNKNNRRTHIYLNNCVFINNTLPLAQGPFGAACFFNNNSTISIYINNSAFDFNTTYAGGIIALLNAQIGKNICIYINDSSFSKNIEGFGSVVNIFNLINIRQLRNCFFMNNSAVVRGEAQTKAIIHVLHQKLFFFPTMVSY